MNTFKLIVISLLSPALSLAQPPGTNLIRVKGVSFNEVANALLDAGYSFDKIDSNFKTIRTNVKNGMLMDFRVKDSVVTIIGWYKFKDELTQINNETFPESVMFLVENSFALSFKKPVEYSKN